MTLLLGSGGSEVEPGRVDEARRQTPGWEWTVLGPASWSTDPYARILDADVVVTHAGENALAEVAAARRPAVVIPQRRPHGEQHATARAITAQGLPAIVTPSWPQTGWADLLARAGRQNGRAWARWCDGRAAERLARVLQAGTGSRVGASA